MNRFFQQANTLPLDSAMIISFVNPKLLQVFSRPPKYPIDKTPQGLGKVFVLVVDHVVFTDHGRIRQGNGDESSGPDLFNGHPP